MKSIIKFTLFAAFAVGIAACGGVAENKPVNTVTNTAAKTATEPTKEMLLEMDKKANEAWTKGDKAHFEAMLSDKFVSYHMGHRGDRTAEINMVSGNKCDVKSFTLDDAQMAKIDNNTYVVTYKSTFDGTCTSDGKTEKIPTPMRASSVWVRNGEKWQGAFHTETAIIDPKAAPADMKADDKKVDDKSEAKSDEKKDDAKPVASANTEALTKAHQAGWEAFKNKDAKSFEASLTSNFAFVDPLGGYLGSKADAIKMWTQDMKCEGVNNVKVTDGVATAISPTVEILTVKGTSDGSCNGQKLGSIYQAAIYVKEGGAWKLAYMFESPAM